MIVKYGVTSYDWGNYCNRDIKANKPTNEWHVSTTVAATKDKTTAKGNTEADNKLLKIV